MAVKVISWPLQMEVDGELIETEELRFNRKAKVVSPGSAVSRTVGVRDRQRRVVPKQSVAKNCTCVPTGAGRVIPSRKVLLFLCSACRGPTAIQIQSSDKE